MAKGKPYCRFLTESKVTPRPDEEEEERRRFWPRPTFCDLCNRKLPAKIRLLELCKECSELLAAAEWSQATMDYIIRRYHLWVLS